MSELIEIRKAAKEIGVCHETLTNWIIKANKKRVPRATGKSGASVLCVSREDLNSILKEKEDPLKDYVSLRTLSKEFKISVNKISVEAHENKIKTVKKKSGNVNGSKLSAVSPEDADRLRDILAPSRTAKAQSSKSVPNAVLENRRLGYYHRLTPQWMMDAWQ